MLLFSTGMYWYFVRPFSDNHHIFLVLDTLLLTNSTPILGTTIGMNYPSWSISSEMISYFAFGICSLLAIRKKKDHLITAITIACFGFLAFQENYFQTGSWGFIRGLACFNLGYLIHMLTTKNIKIHDYMEGFIMIIISTIIASNCHI
jgi:peptidoglycan/LPS O-acetylase OafA/YrhL